MNTLSLLPRSIKISKAVVWFTIFVAIGLSVIVCVNVYFQVGNSVEQLHNEMRRRAISQLQYSITTFTQTRLTVLADQSQLSVVCQATMQPKAMKADLVDLMGVLKLLGKKTQLVLLDYRGRTIHASQASPSFDYEELLWVHQLVDGTITSHVAVSREEDNVLWQLAVPVYYNNNPEGVLVAEIPVDELHYYAEVDEKISNYSIELLFNDDLFLKYGSISEQHSMTIPLEIPGFSVRIIWNDDILNEARYPLLLKVTLVILFGILVTMICALFLAKGFFIDPLTELGNRVVLLSGESGSGRIATNQRVEEISQLAIEFNKILIQVREREQALLAARNELEVKVEERTGQLQQSRNELRQLNENLEQQVDERTRELDTARSRLLMQEKLASVGQLAAGIAHELNNPINFVRTNFVTLVENFEDLLELLVEYRKLGQQLNSDIRNKHLAAPILLKEQEVNVDFLLEDIPVLFQESQYGYERIAVIIKSMLNFSREDQPGEKSWANINNGIKDTLVIARNEYKYTAEVTTELGEVDDIFCSLQQLNQIFLNTIVNAAQAISSQQRKEKGKIWIKTWQDSDFIHCEIGDDGPGIPPDQRSRVFEPFFTTKAPGKGTGLGLSISYDIVVHKHGGKMELHCPEEGGTVFTISLPKQSGDQGEGEQGLNRVTGEESTNE